MTKSRSLKTTAQTVNGRPGQPGSSIPVTLSWERAVPFQVSICFHDTENGVDVVWLFSRDLLCAAYANPEAVYGAGDLQCCISGRDLIMRIVIVPKMLTFSLDAEKVAVLLEDTLHDISVGKEEESEIEECIDTVISDILNEAGA